MILNSFSRAASKHIMSNKKQSLERKISDIEKEKEFEEMQESQITQIEESKEEARLQNLKKF